MTVYPIAHALWTSLHQVMIPFPESLSSVWKTTTSRNREYFQMLSKLTHIHRICRTVGRDSGRAHGPLSATQVFRITTHPINCFVAMGAARCNQRRSMDLGVSSELWHTQRPAP